MWAQNGQLRSLQELQIRKQFRQYKQVGDHPKPNPTYIRSDILIQTPVKSGLNRLIGGGHMTNYIRSHVHGHMINVETNT